MPDCIEELITANLEAALATVATYPNNATPTVERERAVLQINGRYPFIELQGPRREADTQTYKVDMSDLYYVAKYFVNKTDENTTADTELPYLTRNVNADMTKTIMADGHRGGYAQFTRVVESGYDFDVSAEGEVEFFRYIAIWVKARIDAADPYELG